jgi:transcriptional regulator with GAF, ATPase, and Fis domain
MEQGVRFRNLALNLLARFSAVPSHQVDEEVEHSLEELVEFLGTERSSVVDIDSKTGVGRVTHSWARPGIPPVGLNRDRVLPWYHNRLREGETLRFDRLPEELPKDALTERAWVNTRPLRSHVAVPIAIGGRWVCALATATLTDYRTWTDDDVERIRVVGQILANAIYRRNLENELRESLAEVHRMQRRLEAENQYLRESVVSNVGFEEIAGKSLALHEALRLAAQVAPTLTTVLLLGETGTGKELLARAIHARSERSKRPFIRVNCAALPSSLIESELFGHEKGAFTGAASAKMGRFELADGGTLFLDEIAELALEAQAKLLRVLESGEFERIGAIRTRKVDIRIVAATNRDLEHAMAEGCFREDLYYRISSFPIRLPPLRARREDIPLLIWDLIRKRQDKLGRHVERVAEETMEAIAHYSWPGNVRELGNVIERALILSSGPELQLDVALPRRSEGIELGKRLEDVERDHLLHILQGCNWRIEGPGHAAEILGMNPSTLRHRLRRLRITRPAPN